ncbi:MAG: polyphosphate:AMP phosphotransferase [Deltaproteobacteria bacterium]|nr:polyphosphate:AMP phosphotransferase [Deltaproteobacteria bacterium]
MFESAELGHRIEQKTFEREEGKLRVALLDAQHDLREAGRFPVVILIGGVDGAGKGETVNLLNAWMDPRLIQTRAFGEPSDEEEERPRMWRYWRALPPKGRIGILFGSWYTDPIVDRVRRKLKTAALDRELSRIVRFEKMLVNEGALLLKFWFHLSKEKQRRRLKALAKDPRTRWRVTETDWDNFRLYDTYRAVSEHVLRQTSTGEAPWVVVEGEDANYRSLTVGRELLAGIRGRLDEKRPWHARSEAAPLLAPLDGVQVLDRLDLTQRLGKARYEKELEKWQGRVNLLTRRSSFRKRAVVAVFEGNDAAGKGGSIRRVTPALDARNYDIIAVGAPTEEERAQPYLWRFWRHLPRLGRVTIFDRSWYGRVLVERVEGFCSDADWMRAYREINDFEEQLVERGIVVVKFWLSISKQEQIARFRARQKIGFKRFKITEEDWRNRKKWDAYAQAVNDMVERTSTDLAPWTLVEANDKHFARIKILRTLAGALEGSR